MRTLSSAPVTARLLAAAMAAGALCGAPLAASGGAAASAAAGPTCGGERATIVGTGGDDRIRGTSGDDVIAALGGDDTIRGGRGHDLICAGAGVDVLRGGSGADRLVGGLGQTGFPDGELGNDRFVPGPGDDVVVVGPRQRRAALDRIDYSAIGGPVRADLRERRIEAQGEDRVVGTRSVRLIGSRQDDELRGSRADEELIGGAGADLLLGRGGADLLADGAGDDVLRGGAGRDQLTGAAGDDELSGGKDDDSLSDFTHGSRRDDNGVNALRGGQGRDDLTLAIAARAGHVLDGGPGRDSMYFETRKAGKRRWLMDLSSGVATISGVEGTFTVTDLEYLSHQVGLGVWEVTGTDADETVDAAYSRLVARLAGGDDTAFGGGRDDHIDGGPGHDAGFASGGDDTCVSVEDAQDCEDRS